MICRSALLLLVSVVAIPAIAEDSTTDLRYRSYRNWSIELPRETWFPVNDGIKLPGATFAVEFIGNDLRFDTDGDGELDRTIKPLLDKKTHVSTTRVVLSAETKEGEKFRYAVRLREDARGWEWAPGGAMAGVINTSAGPLPIRIIDQDGNGRYNDVGADAMIVGVSDNATFLSKTILVDHKVIRVDVAADGASITRSPYDGPTATIDMTTSFSSRAKLLSAILLSHDMEHSYDVGAIDGAIEVPAGEYTVAAGLLGLGDQRVTIGAGRMKPLQLTANKKTVFDWGGPAQTEFQFARRGDKVQFSPDAIWYFGQAGEQYSGWTPIGKSPEFKVCDAKTGAVLEVAILPGSC